MKKVRMETRYTVYVADSEPRTPLSAYLSAEGAARGPDPDDPCSWCVPAASRTRVKAELQRRSAEFVLFYGFAAEPTDRADRLAAYLGIDAVTSPGVRRREPLLAKDAEDFRILADTAFLTLVGPLVEGVEWEPYEKDPGLWFLGRTTELPDPVRIPGVRELDRNGDVFFASDDGRSVVTGRNLEHLRRYGLAHSTAYSIDGTTYPRLDCPVFGGKVLDAVRRAGGGLVVHLVPEDHDVEPW